ncbi:MAG: hypothetical protein LBB50_02645, partial [Oscillospiraceae bacterium]|nr:hypothetical protein [Oscillospiraceae bacterium]
IDEIIGRPPTSFRPPYGAQNQAVCAAIPMPVLIWSVDTLDWKSRNADAVYRHLMKDTFDGSIVLMHDLYPSTIEAVRRAIPVLKAEGYTFVTVDALLAARGPAAPGEAVFERYPPAS